MFLKYGFNVVGLIFSFYVFYCCSARFLKIKDLPINIISSSDKSRYLGILEKYVLFTSVASILNLVTFLSPVLEIRLIISLVSIFVSNFIFTNLTDEIADFDISKKDSDIIQEFLTKRTNTSKEHEKENKIKKIDIDDLENLDEINKSQDKLENEEIHGRKEDEKELNEILKEVEDIEE